jgi:hypothetical protein
VIMVVGALLVVVVGQAMLANGQVRMSTIDQQLSSALTLHRQIELEVSQLETPSRIVQSAIGQDHMVYPGAVVELPYVPLTTPIPTPSVTPAPSTATTTTATTPAS